MSSIDKQIPEMLHNNPETAPKWIIKEPGTFTTQMVVSLDDIKAKIKTGTLRPAVLTNKGLIVRNHILLDGAKSNS